MAVRSVVVVSAIFVASSLAEWIPVSSTLLRKPTPNNVAPGSTRLFPVPNRFDYADEFACSNVHNLTMLGYGDPPESVPDPIERESIDRLREKLIRQIDDRMTNLGRKRSGKTYHVGFPSLEGALISISLLLFAVYLIKLVMKVVYTFNAKRGTTEYVGFLSNLRQPIVISPNRQRRELELELEGYRINHLIQEQFKFFN